MKDVWLKNLNTGVRDLVIQHASRATRAHLIAAIDEAVARVRELERENKRMLDDYELAVAAQNETAEERIAELEREVARLKERLAVALSAAGLPG